MAMCLMGTVFEWSFPVVQAVVEVIMVGEEVGGVEDEEGVSGEGGVALVATNCWCQDSHPLDPGRT